METTIDAENKLREALDGEGDRILEALDLLDLNLAAIQMIIDNADKIGIETLYQKLTGQSLGIRENF